MNDTLLRARALSRAGRLAYFQSDFPGARRLLEEALALLRQSGDETAALGALGTLIVILTWQGETDGALALLGEGRALLPSVRPRPDALPVLAEFGWAASHLSAPQSVEPAREQNEEVVRRARIAGDKPSLALGLACLAQCFYWQEKWDEARAYYEESVPLLREVGALWMLDYALWGLGQAAFQAGDLDAARTISTEAMTREREVETWVGAPYYLETFAFLGAAQAQLQRAVCLLGAADALRARHQGFAQPLVVAQTDALLAWLRGVLPSVEFETQWQRGRALSTQDAIALALKQGDEEDED